MVGVPPQDAWGGSWILLTSAQHVLHRSGTACTSRGLPDTSSGHDTPGRSGVSRHETTPRWVSVLVVGVGGCERAVLCAVLAEGGGWLGFHPRTLGAVHGSS